MTDRTDPLDLAEGMLQEAEENADTLASTDLAQAAALVAIAQFLEKILAHLEHPPEDGR